MTIGTTLFTDLSAQAFTRLNKEISDLQERVSSGKNDPRASVDPLRSIRLSVANEQNSKLERYTRNLEMVQARLDQTDTTLAEVSKVMLRLREIAVRGATNTATQSERETLSIEIKELRGAIFDLGNSRDGTGRSLFGGFRRETSPFSMNVDGSISYAGDQGEHSLRVSESASMETGLNGSDVFMAIDTGHGKNDIFSIIDDLLFSLAPTAELHTNDFSAAGTMRIDLNATRESQTWKMTVEGPLGSVDISADILFGSSTPMVDAINAQSNSTGVTASLAADGTGIVLNAIGEITIRNVDSSDGARKVMARAQAIDPNGDPVGNKAQMVPARLTSDAQIDQVGGAAEHVADNRAQVGALGQVAERHKSALEGRQLLIDQAVAGLEDLDVAAAITKLQKLLLDRDISQQTFAKITQKTLFDYLR